MVQSQLNTARLIALSRIKDEMLRVKDKMATTYQTLQLDNTIPDPMPKPGDWTNSQLDDMLQAYQEVLAQILIVENAAKFDLLVLDKEKVSRQ